MYFDFEGRNFETPTVESAISWREQALISGFVHLVVAVVVLLGPRLPFIQEMAERRAERLAEIARLQEESRQAMLSPAPEDETFVFVAPRVDVEADEAPREDAPPSDRDRIAQSPERTFDPDNRLPIADGNSSRFVESEPEGADDPLAPLDLEGEPDDSEDGAGDVDEPTPDEPDDPRMVDATSGDADSDGRPDTLSEVPGVSPDQPSGTAGSDSALAQPGVGAGDPDDPGRRPDVVADGLLGQASRTLDRSIRRQTFGNLRGDTGRFGPTIQFDTKGVDFGSWVRRFQAQVYRNWFLPYRVLTDSGHVVLTFNVHRDGRLTDLQVVEPSVIDPFNHSAANALRSSNPTQPLPAEYPDETAFITVTFYFNERPPERGRY